MANGVTAGTLIENTATASYASGGSNGSAQSNAVTVRVDELLDVALASLSSGPASAGPDAVSLAFSITNIGNGPEAFTLTVNSFVVGNASDATLQSIAIDSNRNGGYDPGIDQALASGVPTPPVAPDNALTVFVIVTPPAGLSTGDASQLRLSVAAATGTGVSGAAFAGQGEGGGDAVVGASGAQAQALALVIAAPAAVTLGKSATIADPDGGSQPVPGAVVTYSLRASVGGGGPVDDLRITDPIPPGTSYLPASLRLDGASLTDAIDGDGGVAAPSGIDVALGTVAGGSTHTVTFNVRIN